MAVDEMLMPFPDWTHAYSCTFSSWKVRVIRDSVVPFQTYRFSTQKTQVKSSPAETTVPYQLEVCDVTGHDYRDYHSTNLYLKVPLNRAAK